jgi:hypothetical protein
MTNSETTQASQTNPYPGWRTILIYFFFGAAALAISGDSLRYPDERDYLTIGKNIVAHFIISLDGVHATAYRPPGYPAIIAIFWSIFPAIYLLKFVNLLFWGATGLLTSSLATRLHGTKAGIVASAVFLAYIVELYSATTLYPQTIVGFLVLLSMFFVSGTQSLSRIKSVCLAFCSLFQVFMIPNTIVVVISVYIYGLMSRKIRLSVFILSSVFIVLLLLTWNVRNKIWLGTYAFGTNAGLNLVLGNSEHATPAGGVRTDISYLRPLPDKMTEAETNEFYSKQAINWIIANPERAVNLFGEKFLYWFSYKNEYKTEVGTSLLRDMAGYVTAAFYYPFLLGGFLALFSLDGGKRDVALLMWVCYIGEALLYAVFFTRIRFRIPFDPLLICLSSGIIADLGDKIESRLAWLPGSLRKILSSGG